MEKIGKWIKRRKREVTFLFAVFLASTVSFGAGWAANREFLHAPIIIEKCGAP